LQQWRRPKVGSTEIDAKDIAPSGAPDDVASLSGLGGREATMSEAAGGTVRVVREMSATSMLKGVVCRVDDSSLDGRGLGELDRSHERQQYSHESANTKLGVAGTSNKGVRTKPRVEESVRKDDRSTVGPGIRKKGPKCT